MEVIVKSSPKIEIKLATTVVKVGNGNSEVTVDSVLSYTSENPVQNKVITEELGKKVNKTDMATINGKPLTEGGNIVISDTPDWNASKGKAGHIKGRSHYIDGAISIPFEHWDKRFDEDGNAIYFHTIPPDNYFGCLIREGGWQEENYVFFGTEWKSLYPTVSADIRINYDSDSGESVLEIILYIDADSESFFATFINNSLFAYGQGDFVVPIAKEFIPNTIARQESVDELREETTALWENLDSGTFPDLTAGDLAGRGESVPASFGFRASGGKSIKDGRAYIKRIKGNSVVWNNMVDTRGYEGEFVIRDGVTIIAGHKYLLMREKADGYLYLNPIVDGVEKYDMVLTPEEHAKIFAAQYTDTTDARVYGTTNMGGCIVSDLTKMFQAGNEPKTIEEFYVRVATLGIEDMYAYNEGKVIHCNTESIKSIGDNAFDGNLEFGKLDNGGQNETANNMLRCVNYVRVLPNEKYYMSAARYMGSPVYCYPMFYDENYKFISRIDNLYNTSFITPSNAVYLRFFLYTGIGLGLDYDGVMITLVHSGWKQDTDAGYQPYWQDILPLPIINKYFPDGMKKAGSAHDEIRYNKASGKWEYSKGKIKSVGLSSIIQEETSKDGEFLLTLPTNYAAISSYADIPRLLCSPFITNTVANVNGNNLNDCIYGVDDWLIIRSSRYFTLSDIKAAMAGVILYYESNDWEWEELDEADQNFRDYYNVADFGTEMSHSNEPSAAFSADIIYQFNAVDMIREHEAEINELQSVIATMQAQLTSLINK